MTDFAQELAAQPDLTERLLALHVPDRLGRCRACTRPGTGRPSAPWPCVLYFYATAATQIRRRQIARLGRVGE